jgi:hypothetical protein
VIKEEAEKILKYKDLIIEIQRVWNVKKIIDTGNNIATVTIAKSLSQCLRNITRKHEIKELQKTATLGTAHILQEVLM